MEATMIFANRFEAGRLLAGKLAFYRHDAPVVLGLPRGGVPVGYEVARALDAALDVLVVRKLGAPGQPELAVGAVAPGVTVLDQEMVRLLDVPESYLEAAIARARAEVKRWVALFSSNAPSTDVAGRTVIVVDDGIATGSTALAAVAAVRQLGAARIAIGAPVCAADALALLTAHDENVVCVQSPTEFYAVGYWYSDFTQTTDGEVRELLARRRLERHTSAEGG
jgi:putative phosphoribosyl transferase